MIRYNLIVLLITHVLCDFYFQSQKMAENKQKKLCWVLIHSALYAIAAMVILTILMPGLPWRYSLCFVFLHAIIDIAKYAFCNLKCVSSLSFLNSKQNIFIVDQLFHILTVFAVVYSIRDFGSDVLYNNVIKNIFDVFGVSETIILEWIIKILLIHKPANIFISNMLSAYRPDSKRSATVSDKNAGRFIGTLERIIMTILISINEYSAVGLVLTAKSIARYDKISKEQAFAEYYLLGTLLSTICAIGVSIVF